MKALFSSAVVGMMVLQMSCATGDRPRSATNSPIKNQDNAAQIDAGAGSESSLPAPKVAVMPMKEGVLVAWKPIGDADGYFVYRETQNPPSKKMLGIGPKEAQGFIDRNPPESTARYSVQAFKLSDLSEKQETKALPGTARPAPANEKPQETPAHETTGVRVSYPM